MEPNRYSLNSSWILGSRPIHLYSTTTADETGFWRLIAYGADRIRIPNDMDVYSHSVIAIASPMPTERHCLVTLLKRTSRDPFRSRYNLRMLHYLATRLTTGCWLKQVEETSRSTSDLWCSARHDKC